MDYYKKSYPKSLGLEFVIENIFPITEKYKIKEVDILATYIEHASFQIKRNIDNGSKVLLTGEERLIITIKTLNHDSKINFIVPDKTIINYKESLIFALLGYLKINGKVNCLRSVTGALMIIQAVIFMVKAFESLNFSTNLDSSTIMDL